MSRLHFTYVLLYNLGLIVHASQLSEQFKAVSFIGIPMCSVDPPLVTQGAGSKEECSLQCLAVSTGAGCVAFNFKQDKSKCELFDTAIRKALNIRGYSPYIYQV